jgi:hypothetical protein
MHRHDGEDAAPVRKSSLASRYKALGAELYHLDDSDPMPSPSRPSKLGALRLPLGSSRQPSSGHATKDVNVLAVEAADNSSFSRPAQLSAMALDVGDEASIFTSCPKSPRSPRMKSEGGLLPAVRSPRTKAKADVGLLPALPGARKIGGRVGIF